MIRNQDGSYWPLTAIRWAATPEDDFQVCFRPRSDIHASDAMPWATVIGSPELTSSSIDAILLLEGLMVRQRASPCPNVTRGCHGGLRKARRIDCEGEMLQ